MKKIIIPFVISLLSLSALGQTINIVDLGAVADGKTDNTIAIQKAIDQCSKDGGSVTIPSGRFLISPLRLKSNVNIYLEPGAVLLGNTDINIYHKAFAATKGKKPPALIYGENVENVSISGKGKIDGQGGHSNFQLGDDSESGIVRPIILYFRGSKNIKVTDISLHNSAYWVQKYEACDGVMIRGLYVRSHTNFNNDGMDINGSKNVIISDCYIDTDDDALCFKSEVERYELCENITVTNCVLRSNCSGIKFGTGSMSGFNNVAISNCVIYKASEENRRHWTQTQPWMGITQDTTVISGLALECVDGGVMNGISISNITMKDVQTPIFIRLGDRRRMFSDNVSVLKNINISNIIATSESQLASSITGVPNAYIENVSISNVQITSPGGTINPDAIKTVPENIKGYPENRMFGNVLPAAAFYLRHVKNIRFDNININTIVPDSRPAFYTEDVIDGDFSRCRMNNKNVKPYKFKLTDRNDNTFIGSMNTVIDAMLTAKPNVRFVIESNFTEDLMPDGKGNGQQIIKFQNLLANYWGVHFINLSSKLGFIKRDETNIIQHFMKDGTHPADYPDWDVTNGRPDFTAVNMIARYVADELKPIFADWTNKRILYIGTSIPAGSPYWSNPKAQYPEIIANILGCECDNKAVGGSVMRAKKVDGSIISTTHTPFLNLKSNVNYKESLVDVIDNYDLVIFSHGRNDFKLDETDFNINDWNLTLD